MKRRKFLQGAILIPSFASGISGLTGFRKNQQNHPDPFHRVRPGDTGWPGPEKWQQLKTRVNGNLLKLDSPFSVCNSGNGQDCKKLFEGLKNPYFIGENPALTQTSGWLNAWSSRPSAYAVAARSADEIAAAIDFARENHLRLVVKGGGHSYQGTSNSADSLLIWTRSMDQVELHENFVAQGCTDKPQPAVTIGAGARWLQAYDAVITKGGRYIQGGGCLTVGVAGLILGGGFGSFSKHYGLAAAALLEAEIVTADGKVIIANAYTHPDLFWALKGGGQGSLGVVSKLTLRTRELPENFGAVFYSIQANSEKDFKTLIAGFLNFYKEHLLNPGWGEQVSFRTNDVFNVNMLFHGLTKEQATQTWLSFTQWVSGKPEAFRIINPFTAISIPAQHLWDPAFLRKYAAQNILTDDRPNAPENNIYWKENRDEAGQFLYGYHSAWLPDTLLEPQQVNELSNALFASSRHWTVSLHFNKGLAGAPADEIEAARNTAINPQALKAFALAIIAGEGEPAFAGIPDHEPDMPEAQTSAKKIQTAMDQLMKVAPGAGSYISESNYFEKNWQQSFWGDHYARLNEIKKTYDPEGLFFVHHGVGSEEWSNDGFTKMEHSF